MVTFSEARTRCEINGMRLYKRNQEFRVTFNELERHNPRRAEITAYYTDDVEDAMLTASAMRHRLNGKLAA